MMKRQLMVLLLGTAKYTTRQPADGWKQAGFDDNAWKEGEAAFYSLTNGQTYGGDMPIEESGNMVVLAATIAKMEGKLTK